MAKRMSETEIWNDPWYRKLPAEGKVIWKFLLDRCDAAGFWKKDFELAEFLCGIAITDEHLEGINKGKERVRNHGEHLEIVDFVKFQYGELSPDCNPHKPVIALLKNYEKKGYVKGIDTLKDKEQEKDQDKEQDTPARAKPEDVAYLERVPQDDAQELAEKYRISPKGIQAKADDLRLYCESKGKKYKDYKAFLEQALRKDQANLRAQYPLPPPRAPAQAPDTPEERANREKINSKIHALGEKLRTGTLSASSKKS